MEGTCRYSGGINVKQNFDGESMRIKIRDEHSALNYHNPNHSEHTSLAQLGTRKTTVSIQARPSVSDLWTLILLISIRLP